MFERGRQNSSSEWRILAVVFSLAAAALVIRLFSLQVLAGDYYSTLALSAHEIYQKLHPERGQIFFQDSRDGSAVAVAVNRRFYQIYAVPQEVKKEDVGPISDKLAGLLDWAPEKSAEARQKLSKSDDPYELLDKKIPEEKFKEIEQAGLKGIYGAPEVYRYYPEENWSEPVVGFCAFDDDNNLAGRYGVEGYWDKTLAGQPGFLLGERAANRGWISLAGMTAVEAKDGADIYLTIDRALQYQACARLRRGVEDFGASGGSLVMMDPKTGAILAMCSEPDYDPNNYSKETDVSVFNNSAVFTPYEPGSVFKPVVMSAALDLGLVAPGTSYTDPCERKFGPYTIHNAMNKCYGRATMTEVLQNSINTGMIWVEEQMPREKIKDYLEKLGFGQKTGVPLDSEAAGNISSLDKKGDIYAAQASFGQGLTVTPLQLATAYSAMANQGQTPSPYLVKEIRYPDGRRERFEPKMFSQAISPRAAQLITSMLTSVVEKTYVASVRLPDYYLAGKTGTAQIPGPGGYREETNHTFAGFGPVASPRFVMVVKFEKPQRQWAEATAAVVFRDLAKFALDYYGIKGDK